MKTCCGSSVLEGAFDCEEDDGSDDVDQATGGRRVVQTT